MSHAAILGLLVGDPDTDHLESRLDDGFPAVKCNATEYLDGRTIHHGTVADRISEEVQAPVIGTNGIHTESEKLTRKVAADFYADLEEGWAGVDASDGMDILEAYLLATAGLKLEPTVLNLDVWSDRFEQRDRSSTWGVSFSQAVEDGHEKDRAGAYYHDEVDERILPNRGKKALGFRYSWEGSIAYGMVAASGFATIYRAWTTAQFARWVADEILPFLEADAAGVATKQATLDDQGDTEGVV